MSKEDKSGNDGIFNVEDNGVDDPLTHDVGDDNGLDDPLTHDVGDDNGVDDPLTHDVGDDNGVDDPLTHDVGDDNGVDDPLTHDIGDDSVTGGVADDALPGGSALQAYRLYQAAFDRAPDKDGLGYWIFQLDQGVGLVQVAGEFVRSDEFRGLYGADPSDDDFVRLLYLNVLNREPDQAGYEYWTEVLAGDDKGGDVLSRAELLMQFSESAENQQNVAALIGVSIDFNPWAG